MISQESMSWFFLKCKDFPQSPQQSFSACYIATWWALRRQTKQVVKTNRLRYRGCLSAKQMPFWLSLGHVCLCAKWRIKDLQKRKRKRKKISNQAMLLHFLLKYLYYKLKRPMNQWRREWTKRILRSSSSWYYAALSEKSKRIRNSSHHHFL